MNITYPMLSKPLRLRNTIFQNRIFVSSMGCPPTHKHPSSPRYDAGVGFYDKTFGGAAAMLVNVPPVARDGTYPKYERDQIRELMSLATQSGSKAGAGLGAFGFDSEKNIHYGPSTYCKPNGEQLYEIGEAAMEQVLMELEASARAAKNFGFDYIQYHMAHESMMSHFLAPGFNQRTDAYGGSLANRMKFPLRAIQALRKGAGETLPIIVRLSAVLHCEESYAFEEMLEFIGLIQDEVDMINVSCGMDTWYETNVYHCTTPFQPHQINAHWAAQIKQTYPKLKVCPVGGIVDPQDAEELLVSGQADAVMLGRAMNADPLWPKKALEGRREDIVPCLRCSYCYHAANDHQLIACSVNPRLFRENRVPFVLEKTTHPKHVVIIGAGPGGCKAALTAAEKGHRVTLLEQHGEVGGQIRHARYDAHKKDLDRYRSYLQYQIDQADITVQYHCIATPELIAKLQPDALLIAIGAKPVVPAIPGIDLPHVEDAIAAYEHLETIEQRVVIVGGGTIGCELGLRLAEDGHDVHVIEMGNKLCANGHMLYNIGIRKAFAKVADRLHFHTESICKEIRQAGVLIVQDGNEVVLPADRVLIAVGLQPLKEEAMAFYGMTPFTYLIGDCDRVGKVLEATNTAYFIAANL